MSTPHPQSSAARDVDLSVVIASRGDGLRSTPLLRCLAAQTLAPSLFEVLLVHGDVANLGDVPRLDDLRSQSPGVPWPFRLELLPQPPAGPWAARNIAVERARGPVTLFLDEDALPDATLLDAHLEAHERLPPRTAVLGAERTSSRATRSRFTLVAEHCRLLRDDEGLRDRTVHGWEFFRASNLSVPTAALVAAGGFDDLLFSDDVGGDLDLGWRLQARGWQVLHRAELVCEHDPAPDLDRWLARQARLGQALTRMWRKHRQSRILWFTRGQSPSPALLQAARAEVEAFHPRLVRLRAALAEPSEPEDVARLADQLRPDLARLALVGLYAGLLRELEQDELLTVLDRGPDASQMTSMLVHARNERGRIEPLLAGLRAERAWNPALEIIWVDDCSDDGSRAILEGQPDVILIENPEPLGRAASLNRALARARGERLVFVTPEVQLRPGWLVDLAFHSAVDGKSGCVAADFETDAAAAPADAEGYARQRGGSHHRRYASMRQVEAPLVLVRRAVIDRIGGLDERLRHGFELEDFSIRAALAGFRNRKALDVWVGCPSPRDPGSEERAWAGFLAKWAGSARIGVRDWKTLDFSLIRPWNDQLVYAPLPLAAQRSSHKS
jgi:GT2 family glycosyltransferase